MASKAERKRRKRTVIIAKGAPMRPGVDRYPGGQIVHRDRKPRETQEEAMATVRAQPHRSGFYDVLRAGKAASSFGADPEKLIGSALGRLYLSSKVQRHQYEAGVRYAENMARDRATIGLPPVNAQAMRYGDSGGVSRADVSSKVAQEAAERMTRARAVLLAVGDECKGDVVRPGIVVRQVTLEERDDVTLSEHEIGALRLGLNALARLYGIDVGGDRPIAA